MMLMMNGLYCSTCPSSWACVINNKDNNNDNINNI